MSKYFRKPSPLGENVKAELRLSNYVTKEALKNAIEFDTSKFAKQVDLSTLKSEIDKLDIDKFETALVNLSKLSDVVENEVVKKTTYDELIKKLNAIQTTDTSDLVKKADYDFEKKLELKIKLLIMIIVIIILLLKNLIG